MKIIGKNPLALCKPILSTEGMRALDNETKAFNAHNENFGIQDLSQAYISPIEAGYRLMKEAGEALFQRVIEFLGDSTYGVTIAVFVGGGNNGGDGLVLAKRLLEEGIHCVVYSLAKEDSFKNEARMAYEDLLQNGGSLVSAVNGLPANPNFKLVVDCMLGNGASGELRPAFAMAVEIINHWNIPVLAADAPTGYDSANHRRGESCIRAEETMLFGLPRLDAYTHEGSEVFGRINVAPLHYPDELVRRYDQRVYLAEENLIPGLLPTRDESGEKRSQGCAMIIAGSGNMTGAAALCTEAALRSGTGLVTLATPKAILPVLQTKLSEPVFCGLGSSSDETLSMTHIMQLQDAARHQRAIAIGPGLGTDSETQDAIRIFLSGVTLPTVIDADAINACGSSFFCMEGAPQDVIITPHKREWERNFGPLPSSESYYPEYLKQVADQFKITILLKGSPTYIATPDGRVFVIPARNSGLAKGGSGDVLTGIIVALLAQGLPTDEAAVLGALLHQKAGRITREEMGAFSMLPSDVIQNLSKAFKV